QPGDAEESGGGEELSGDGDPVLHAADPASRRPVVGGGVDPARGPEGDADGHGEDDQEDPDRQPAGGRGRERQGHGHDDSFWTWWAASLRSITRRASGSSRVSEK